VFVFWGKFAFGRYGLAATKPDEQFSAPDLQRQMTGFLVSPGTAQNGRPAPPGSIRFFL
jgi:hypothetical protein